MARGWQPKLLWPSLIISSRANLQDASRTFERPIAPKSTVCEVHLPSLSARPKQTWPSGFESDPSGALVFVNGMEQGTTPTTIKVEAEDRVDFRLDNYRERVVVMDSDFNLVAIINGFSFLFDSKLQRGVYYYFLYYY